MSLHISLHRKDKCLYNFAIYGNVKSEKTYKHYAHNLHYVSKKSFAS